MRRKPTKVILVGLDGAMPSLVKKMVDEGIMPNLRGLMEEGAFTEAWPTPPCNTPTNWTTIATGATPSTHKAVGFYPRKLDEPLDLGQREESRGRSFLSSWCEAEYIWEALDRQGVRCVAINYLVGWPPRNLERGAMINGDGIPPHRLSGPLKFTRPGREGTLPVRTQRNVKVKGLPIRSSKPPIECRFEVRSPHLPKPVQFVAHLVALDSGEYNALYIPRAGATVKASEWSPWIRRTFPISEGKAGEWTIGWLPQMLPQGEMVEGFFRLRLEGVSPSGEGVEVSTTPIFTTFGYAHPESLARGLITECDLGLEGLPPARMIERLGEEAFGEEFGYLDHYRAQAARMVEALKYTAKEVGWEACFLHFHPMDSVNHRFLGRICKGSPWWSKEAEEEAWEHYRRGYKACDELIGALMREFGDEETLWVIVSDHSAVPCWKEVRLIAPFIKAGLLAYEWDPVRRVYRVDWSQTRAFPYAEPPVVWVNLEGRDATGIVKPEEYEAVREEIIDVLYSIRDPMTGERAVALALRWEDAGFLGLGDRRVGDVVYFLRPPFQLWDGTLEDFHYFEVKPERIADPPVRLARAISGNHDPYLPTAKIGDLSVSAFLVLSGPGVKRGAELQRPVWLTDVAPTICQLLELEPPRECEGRVIWEVLEK